MRCKKTWRHILTWSIKISYGNLEELVRVGFIEWNFLGNQWIVYYFTYRINSCGNLSKRIHRCWNLRGKVEEDEFGQPAEMYSWKMCGRTTRQSSHWWQMDTHAYRLKQVARDRVEARPVYVRVCLRAYVCAHTALFIRAVNQNRYDITLCETKREERGCAEPTCFGMSPLVTEIMQGLNRSYLTPAGFPSSAWSVYLFLRMLANEDTQDSQELTPEKCFDW